MCMLLCRQPIKITRRNVPRGMYTKWDLKNCMVINVFYVCGNTMCIHLQWLWVDLFNSKASYQRTNLCSKWDAINKLCRDSQYNYSTVLKVTPWVVSHIPKREYKLTSSDETSTWFVLWKGIQMVYIQRFEHFLTMKEQQKWGWFSFAVFESRPGPSLALWFRAPSVI